MQVNIQELLLTIFFSKDLSVITDKRGVRKYKNTFTNNQICKFYQVLFSDI